jgi:hypothetical protein
MNPSVESSRAGGLTGRDLAEDGEKKPLDSIPDPWIARLTVAGHVQDADLLRANPGDDSRWLRRTLVGDEERVGWRALKSGIMGRPIPPRTDRPEPDRGVRGLDVGAGPRRIVGGRSRSQQFAQLWKGWKHQQPIVPDGLLARVWHTDFSVKGNLVSLLTKPAMNSGHAWRTTDASSDSSRSIQKGGHSDGCIPAMKPTHGS